MKYIWLLIGVIPILIGIIRIKQKMRIRQNVQFWTKSYRQDIFDIKKTIHFPTMSLRSEGISKPCYFHVKRTQDGTWLYKWRENSFWANNLCNAINVSRSADGAKTDLISFFELSSKATIDDLNWKAMDDTVFDGSLETAYQKYINTTDIPIVKMIWDDDELATLNKWLSEAGIGYSTFKQIERDLLNMNN
jgi:hypothetical protein